MSDDGEEPWYARGLRFGCTRCGRCCEGPEPGYVEVGGAEVQRLADHLGLTVEVFGRRYLRRLQDGRTSLTEYPNRDCIFWDRESGCAVYPARPDQCRTFPFWSDVLETPEAWAQQAKEMCPGMGEGELYSYERIQRILDGGGETQPGPSQPIDPPRGRRLKTVD